MKKSITIMILVYCLINPGKIFSFYESDVIKTFKSGPVISVLDTVVGTSDCFSADIKLSAQVSDHCNDIGLIWKYLIINELSLDTIQYSYNFLPEPDQGIKGNIEYDLLLDTNRAELMILKSLSQGRYIIKWYVKDECWDEIMKEQLLIISDITPPATILIKNYSPYPVNGNVEINARLLDKGLNAGNTQSSYDNCTEKNDLIFTFTPVLPKLSDQPIKWMTQFAQYGRNFFDPTSGAISTEQNYFDGSAHAWYPHSKSSSRILGCYYFYSNNLPVKYLKVYVWDEFLESDNISVNYSVDSCKFQANWDCLWQVTGEVISLYNKTPLDDFTIHITNGGSEYFTRTDESGNYSHLVSFENVEVEAYKEGIDYTGLTTLDLLYILKYILGLKSFSNPYNIIAADLNGSGDITMADILTIRHIILGIPVNSFRSWIGIKKDYVWQDPLNPLKELEKAKKYIFSKKDFLNLNLSSDFTGIKVGDINLNNLNSRNKEKFELLIEDQLVERGKRIKIPVISTKSSYIDGLQFAIDNSCFSNFYIESGTLQIDDTDYHFDENNFKLVYVKPQQMVIEEGQVLFYLVFQSNTSNMLSSLLHFDENSLSAELYSGNEIEISELKLVFRNHEFEVFQNDPNPLKNKTEIRFLLPAESDYFLTIFDINGHTIFNQKSHGNQGLNNIGLDSQTFEKSGIYYYKIISGNYSGIKKMVFIQN